MESNEQDDIVDQVRAARQAYAEQFDYDIRRMIEDLQTKEAQYPELRADLHPLEPKFSPGVKTDG